jgi:hypothetical protein
LWEGCQYRCKSKKRHHMNSHLRSHVPLSPFHCHVSSCRGQNAPPFI